MFAKPYKLKSNNTLKNTEKKHLAQRIQQEFPTATDEKVKQLVPVKSNCSCMKVILHSGDTVSVYVVDGLPVMIDLGDRLVPTVCALWKLPNLVPTINIHPPVLAKIQGGAPLYAPGVVTETSSFPQFPLGAVIAVCTRDNSAAGFVGHALMSSADLQRAPMGVCLETLHVFGDQLCKDIKFSKIERPKLAPPTHPDIVQDVTANMNQLNIESVKEEWPSLVREPPVANEPAVIPDTAPPGRAEPEPTPTEETDETLDLEVEETDETSQELNDSGDAGSPPADMDGLLRWCLLTFLKLEGRRAPLPLKTNLLYRNHLMPLCPPDRSLDVKKSNYKKMSKFLEAMEREGLVQVREIDKGVAALVALQHAHPLVRAHRPGIERVAERGGAERGGAERGGAERGGTNDEEYVPPQIRELYCVTAVVAELFAPIKKGAALSGGEVREVLQQYVRQRALAEPQAPGSVRLDPLLAALAGRRPQELMRWEELGACVRARMTPGTELRLAGGRARLTRSRLEPVRLQVATRAGNKRVTLVSNLEAYGFSLRQLARVAQLRAGAAAGVTRSAGARADQLMLQGDQTHLMAKLLIEQYGLPKKYLEGADKALSKKK